MNFLQLPTQLVNRFQLIIKSTYLAFTLILITIKRTEISQFIIQCPKYQIVEIANSNTCLLYVAYLSN